MTTRVAPLQQLEAPCEMNAKWTGNRDRSNADNVIELNTGRTPYKAGYPIRLHVWRWLLRLICAASYRNLAFEIHP